ncbi:MAG: hypothetical protein OXN83_03745 [Oligoflexia bacterium]|nr:hypothetical protein [Oligoflexia bacterium]
MGLNTLILFENSSLNEIPPFAGVLAFGERQNKPSGKLKQDWYKSSKLIGV